MNFGKQPFVLTEAAEKDALSRILPDKQITLITVGDAAMGQVFANFLQANGISFTRWIKTGHFSSTEESHGPISIERNSGTVQVVLDPSK